MFASVGRGIIPFLEILFHRLHCTAQLYICGRTLFYSVVVPYPFPEGIKKLKIIIPLLVSKLTLFLSKRQIAPEE